MIQKYSHVCTQATKSLPSLTPLPVDAVTIVRCVCVCAAAANLFRLRFFLLCSAVSPTISLLLQFVHWIIDFVLSCCSIFDVFFRSSSFSIQIKEPKKKLHSFRSVFSFRCTVTANICKFSSFYSVFFVLLCISQLVCAVWPAAYYFVASHCVFGLDCGMMKRYIYEYSTIIYMMAMHQNISNIIIIIK